MEAMPAAAVNTITKAAIMDIPDFLVNDGKIRSIDVKLHRL